MGGSETAVRMSHGTFRVARRESVPCRACGQSDEFVIDRRDGPGAGTAGPSRVAWRPLCVLTGQLFSAALQDVGVPVGPCRGQSRGHCPSSAVIPVRRFLVGPHAMPTLSHGLHVVDCDSGLAQGPTAKTSSADELSYTPRVLVLHPQPRPHVR